jgi:type II restriction enzyme
MLRSLPRCLRVLRFIVFCRLNGIRTLGKTEFTNDDAYTLEKKLSELHPDNRNVRPKIRQQLQVLRDLGLLIHDRPGVWRLP